MPAKRIYLLRHARPRLPDGEKRYIGQTDVPLDKSGEEQARLLGKMLQGQQLAKIISSDLQRARGTAEIIAGACSLPLEIEAGLREIDLGQWEARAVSEIKTTYPREYELRGQKPATFHPPGGENFSDLQKRILPVFFRLVSAVRGNLAVVGHAGVNRVILAYLLGMDLNRVFVLEQDYGCVNILSNGRNGWGVTAINCSPLHLKG